MRENEGQILFWVDATAPQAQQRRLRRLINGVIETLSNKDIASALLAMLEHIVRQWRESHPRLDVAELCVLLAEKSLARAPQPFRESVEAALDRLDGHLLALAVEFDITPDNPDRLQEVLRDSLLLLQAENNGGGGVSAGLAQKLLMSRIRCLHRRHPSQSVRLRLYKLGMSLSDCEHVESNRDALWELLSECAGWWEWSASERVDMLYGVAEFLLSLSDLRPKRQPPPQWKAIFSAWMRGMSPAEMAKQPEIAAFSADATVVCLLVEDLCGMRLPWGINSVLNYLAQSGEDRGEALPPVCNMLSAMVKCGVLDPVAACLVPFVDQKRSLAVAAAAVCPHDCDRPDRIVAWFNGIAEDDLTNAGLETRHAQRIIAARDAFDNANAAYRPTTASTTVIVGKADEQNPLSVGERVLLTRRADQSPSHYQLFRLDGSPIGLYRRVSGPVPDWWDGVWTQATVSSIERRDEGGEAVGLSVESL